MISEKKIEQMLLSLPLPSDCKSEDIAVPFFNNEYFYLDEYGNTRLAFSQVLFKKDYIDGICVGWVLKEME